MFELACGDYDVPDIGDGTCTSTHSPSLVLAASLALFAVKASRVSLALGACRRDVTALRALLVSQGLFLNASDANVSVHSSATTPTADAKQQRWCDTERDRLTRLLHLRREHVYLQQVRGSHRVRGDRGRVVTVAVCPQLSRRDTAGRSCVHYAAVNSSNALEALLDGSRYGADFKVCRQTCMCVRWSMLHCGSSGVCVMEVVVVVVVVMVVVMVTVALPLAPQLWCCRRADGPLFQPSEHVCESCGGVASAPSTCLVCSAPRTRVSELLRRRLGVIHCGCAVTLSLCPFFFLSRCRCLCLSASVSVLVCVRVRRSR